MCPLIPDVGECSLFEGASSARSFEASSTVPVTCSRSMDLSRFSSPSPSWSFWRVSWPLEMSADRNQLPDRALGLLLEVCECSSWVSALHFGVETITQAQA